MSDISRWLGGWGVLGGETIDLMEVEGMRSNLKKREGCIVTNVFNDPPLPLS